MATAKTLDMTDVKDGGQFNKKRVPLGDYAARITKVDDAKVKKGDNEGADQWLFTISLVDFPSTKYPYYCTLVPNQLWKVRNLAIAAGISVPKKRIKIDPNKLVGKLIGVSMADDEYDGREQSVVESVFPASELEATGSKNTGRDEEDEDEGEDEDEEVEEPPRRPAKKAARKPEPEPEEDDEEEDDEESGDAFDAMNRTELKEYLKTADDSFVAKKSQTDDDLRALARAVDAGTDDEEDEEDEEEPPPPPKRAAKKTAKKRAAVTDDELDELDLDDLD